MSEINQKLKYIRAAIVRSEQPFETYASAVLTIENKLKAISIGLYGDPIKSKLDLDQLQTPANRIGTISYEQKYTTSTPTKTHQDSYAIAKTEIDAIKKQVETIYNTDIKQLEDKLVKSGMPYTPGRGYEFKN